MVKTAKKECVKDKIIHISTGFFPWVFSNFGKNTVVQTVVSPNEKYYAQFIDTNQGALGGNTIADVYNNGFDTIVFQINQKININNPRKVCNNKEFLLPVQDGNCKRSWRSITS